MNDSNLPQDPASLARQFYARLKPEHQKHFELFMNRYPTGLRKCCACGETMPLFQFATKVPEKGVLQSRCRACAAITSARHYKQNTEKVIAASAIRNKQRAATNGQYAKAVLQTRCCWQCGTTENLFFHTPELNRMTPVHQAVYSGLSMEKLKRAIAAARVSCWKCYRTAQGSILRLANNYRRDRRCTGKLSRALILKYLWRKYQPMPAANDLVGPVVHPKSITKIKHDAVNATELELYVNSASTSDAVIGEVGIDPSKVFTGVDNWTD